MQGYGRSGRGTVLPVLPGCRARPGRKLETRKEVRIKMMTREKRPVLKLPLTRMEIGFEVTAALGVLAIIFMTVLFWPALPELVPRHFGFTGKADAWADRNFVIFLPAVALLLYAAMTALGRYPHLFNYPWAITPENARVQYRLARTFFIVVKTEVVWSFAYVQWKSIQVALGRAEGLGAAWTPVFLMVVFGALGLYLYRASRFK